MKLRRCTGALVAALSVGFLLAGPAAQAAPSPGQRGHHGDIAGDRALLAAMIDSALLETQPADSIETRKARAQLAELSGRLEKVVEHYDGASQVARKAERRAHTMRTRLRAATKQAVEAAHQFRRDRRNLVTLVNDSYMTTSLGAVGLVLSSEGGADLVSSLSIAEQISADQSVVVEDAQRSATRLAAAELRAEKLDAQAQTAAREAGAKVAQLRAARRAVLVDVRAARTVLAGSLLADQVDASLSAAALAGLRMAEGSVVFPLAPGASFVNQDNFGGRGARWASSHTGVDLSTACGTPVLSASAGTVEVRTDQPWSGRWLVLVRAEKGTVATWYAHMQGVSVASGDSVKAGQVLGQVGSEGNSSGCHLHFEYHPAGGSIYEDATDPVPWLKALGAYPNG